MNWMLWTAIAMASVLAVRMFVWVGVNAGWQVALTLAAWVAWVVVALVVFSRGMTRKVDAEIARDLRVEQAAITRLRDRGKQ